MKSWNLRGGCSFSFNSPAVYFMHTAGACWYFVHSGCTFKPKLSLYCVLLTVLFYLHLKGRRWSEIKASDKRISDSNVDFVRRCFVSSHIPFTWDIMWTKLTFESKVNKWICCQRSKVKQLLVHRYSVFHNERSQPSVWVGAGDKSCSFKRNDASWRSFPHLKKICRVIRNVCLHVCLHIPAEFTDKKTE